MFKKKFFKYITVSKTDHIRITDKCLFDIKIYKILENVAIASALQPDAARRHPSPLPL